MAKHKSFKLHIDSVVALNLEGLDFSEIQVQIKNQSGSIVKSLPLNQLSQTITTVDTSYDLVVYFCLLQYNPMGARQYRLFAEGKLNVQSDQVQRHEIITVGCTIKNIITNKGVVSLAIIIKQDLEKKTFLVPESQISSILDQITQDHKQTITTPLASPRTEKIAQKKLSPLKRASKKPVRNRHFQYQVKTQTPNVQLNNKVTDEQSISVQNLRLDLDEAISSIQFYGHTYQEMLAQIMFKTNPTEEDLKNLKIKVPESEKMIDIHLKTIEGEKLFASTNLPNLQQKQCLKISCDFKNQNNDIKGSLRFNYKQSSDENQVKPDKMNMAEQISMFKSNSRKKEKLEFVPFFFPEAKNVVMPSPSQQSPRLKLPKLLKREPKFESLTINEKIRPEEKKIQQKLHRQDQYSNRSALGITKPSRLSNEEQLNNIRLYRSKTIHSRNHMRPRSPKLPPQSRVKTLKIMSISIKFHKSYLQREGRFMQKEAFVGKFLQIYSNSTQIYRSEPVYSNSTLNWKLNNCHIPITECDNLTIELNLEREKTLIGELVLSYNQLRFNQQENFLYFGYLTHDYDTIAKIHIQFILKDGQGEEFPERRTRMKRLYSEDIAYHGNQESYKKPISNKISLHESLADPIQSHNAFSAHKYRLCQQQKQLDLLREKKRKKNQSPLRREKLYY